MSDLSLPPLTLVPPEPAGAGAAMPPVPAGTFNWPAPPDALHGGPQPLTGPEPAELEGPNGTVTLCRLLAMDGQTGAIQVQTGTSRGPLNLKLGQFRRLTLLRPLKPEGVAPDRATSRHALELVRLVFRDGHGAEVKSHGLVELPIGHFTFSPLNAQGHLLRSFYPRPMVTQISRSELGRTSVDKVLAAAGQRPAADGAATVPAGAASGSPATRSSSVSPGAPPAATAATAPTAPTVPTVPVAPVAPAARAAAQPGAAAPGAALPNRQPPAADAMPRLADPLPSLEFELADLPDLRPAAPRPAVSGAAAASSVGAPAAARAQGPARPAASASAAAGLGTGGPAGLPSGAKGPAAPVAQRPAPTALGASLSLAPLPDAGKPGTVAAAGAIAGTAGTAAAAATGATGAKTAPGAAAGKPAPSAAHPMPAGPGPAAASAAAGGPGARAAAAMAPAGRPSAPPPALKKLPELTQVVPPAVAKAVAGSRSISDMLQVQQISTPAQLLEAIAQQARMPMVRIGEALMALGFITEQKLGDALQAQSRDRSLPLGELLVRRGDVSRTNLQTALARKMGYPMVDGAAFPHEKEALMRLPPAVARRLAALPLMLDAGRLIVALEDPSARTTIDEVEFTSQCKVVPVLARAGSLADAVEIAYRAIADESHEGQEQGFAFNGSSDHNTDKLLADLEQEEGEIEIGPMIEQSDNSLVRLINSMIMDARQQGVSDIHIECPPAPQKVKVRFRRDGVLRHYLDLPPGYRQAIVARIKVMCDLDISERRKPQDGKISFSRFMQGHKLELRVATIPTANGLEDVVMRLLSSAKALPLDAMALQPDVLKNLRETMERPYGLVLCVGPTGSGKTTTLHAALAHINTPERKIWTAEDPVEITQPGLRQVQVNAKIEWTFARALRAFLRADPDVVMVGEVRDEETASMAIEASLTGHLVLSTLHTNSAPETVTRLLDMGMDPFSFADSLLAILAQRLVRRWCKECVVSEPMPEDVLDSLLFEYQMTYRDEAHRPNREALLSRWTEDYGREGRLMYSHAPGCSKCAGSGYDGRLGLHELLTVTREMRVKIQQKAPAAELQRQAMADGMRTLRQDGLLKVLAGLTSIEEVRAISNQ